MRCYVVRHKSRMGGGHRFDFFMSLSPTNDMYCFTGKKQSVAKGCYYSISLDQVSPYPYANPKPNPPLPSPYPYP